MNERAIILMLVMAALSAPSMAQQVHLDWDESVNFSALETFAWKDTGSPSLESAEPLLHQHVVDTIIGQLESAGLRPSDADPDFFITYHAESQTEVRVDTADHGYAYGRAWRWGHMGPSTARAYTYDRGTLVVDTWDGGTNRLIWRGTASAVLSESPDKARKQIDRAIKKIVKKWNKEYRKK